MEFVKLSIVWHIDPLLFSRH